MKYTEVKRVHSRSYDGFDFEPLYSTAEWLFACSFSVQQIISGYSTFWVVISSFPAEKTVSCVHSLKDRSSFSKTWCRGKFIHRCHWQIFRNSLSGSLFYINKVQFLRVSGTYSNPRKAFFFVEREVLIHLNIWAARYVLIVSARFS